MNYQLSEKERCIAELQKEQRDKYNTDSRTQSSRTRNSCDVCVKCRSAGSCICRSTTPAENCGPSKVNNKIYENFFIYYKNEIKTFVIDYFVSS